MAHALTNTASSPSDAWKCPECQKQDMTVATNLEHKKVIFWISFRIESLQATSRCHHSMQKLLLSPYSDDKLLRSKPSFVCDCNVQAISRPNGKKGTHYNGVNTIIIHCELQFTSQNLPKAGQKSPISPEDNLSSMPSLSPSTNKDRRCTHWGHNWSLANAFRCVLIGQTNENYPARVSFRVKITKQICTCANWDFVRIELTTVLSYGSLLYKQNTQRQMLWYVQSLLPSSFGILQFHKILSIRTNANKRHHTDCKWHCIA